ncbi:hypothetical protein QTH91_20035 [Variovorax dokdonensis]|uniref:Uncharacterized protein n=1 Tax=Variovorax dokdonensis TaxID=344883 RepID=A0ABT7NFU3_9BURK|nr:hypothetical protein [Variovorax dokdonensis]MDM0046792.1 hypothetical protein [Variovorax dokdonensis]
MTSPTQPSDMFELDESRREMRYRGWHFAYAALPAPGGHFTPVVELLSDGHAQESGLLPLDTEDIAYATEDEALRHAQQQAMRWVHDRTGDGQGQF